MRYRIKKFTYVLLSTIILLSVLFVLWNNHGYLFNSQPKLNNKEYPYVLDSIQTIRKKLCEDSADTATLEKKFTYLITHKIFPYWYGTKWNFNGTTEKPNEGSIACGYFVTTTLRDMGVPINRTKMAQCASEEMIKNLCSKKHIQRFSKTGMNEFEKKLQKSGNGLYVIGLDNHTGFILLSSKGNYFIHSNGTYPFQVVKDKLSESSILIKSNYRIVGKISSDKAFLKKWIESGCK